LLRDALDHGLPPEAAGGLEKDANFASLRSDPRFATLVADARRKAVEVP
jgi:hypothetical protein